MAIEARVFCIRRKRGRPMGASLKPSCLTICVGLAERGQRRAEAPLVRLDQSQARFLCRSQRTDTTLWRDAKTTVRHCVWLCEEPKVPIRSAISYSCLHDDSNSIHKRTCAFFF